MSFMQFTASYMWFYLKDSAVEASAKSIARTVALVITLVNYVALPIDHPLTQLISGFQSDRQE